MKRRLEVDLLSWRSRTIGRRPLLVFGARQVGKTYLLREFGKAHYENVAYVNLETNRAAAASFGDDISPRALIQLLETETNERIHPQRTLVILDEIQSAPRALTSLKYFAEDAPDYHVAGVGSLLGVAINREQQSYPVGNVESLTLTPLDFEEYLWALGEDRLAEAIQGAYETLTALPTGLHARAVGLYHRYLVIGGMPRPINEYVQTSSLLGIGDIQRGIINDYTADMAKYTTPAETVKIRAAYNSLPAQLAKDNHKFQYKLAERGGTAAIFGAAIDWLVQAGIVLRCDLVTTAQMPLAVYRDLAGFKLYSGDTGLLTLASGIPINLLLSAPANLSFLGALTENYVGQTLHANQIPLYYWTAGNRAEIDFVIQHGDDIVPIEVKASTNTRSRSRSVFVDQFNNPYSIRLSTKNFGSENSIVSIPLYAAHCIRPPQR
ncbi:MAG: ATP-binding protein [Propionibacteriaceae bacterium]|jgi:predicted AAA+ superfamily ATPase|nr:ATP-binding protein [Propionibacteriaceae bacterium]